MSITNNQTVGEIENGRFDKENHRSGNRSNRACSYWNTCTPVIV